MPIPNGALDALLEGGASAKEITEYLEARQAKACKDFFLQDIDDEVASGAIALTIADAAWKDLKWFYNRANTQQFQAQAHHEEYHKALVRAIKSKDTDAFLRNLLLIAKAYKRGDLDA
jgi:hypothetical protein